MSRRKKYSRELIVGFLTFSLQVLSHWPWISSSLSGATPCGGTGSAAPVPNFLQSGRLGLPPLATRSSLRNNPAANATTKLRFQARALF